jgi:ribonuclease R
MHELGMILRARRFAVGALELTLPEVKIDLDRDGRVCGAHVAPHDESHEIIEEFMLAANVAIATALADRGIPFLRRVHADPDETKLRAFGEFVSSLGFKPKKFQSRSDLQRLLDLVHERPERHAVNYAFLRSLKQAAYSPEPLGHYALAFDNYCHFTSPIRRYPDLMVHRLVDELARRGRVSHAPNESELIGRGLHCSTTERRAEQAERELVKIKLLTYLSGRVGEELDAVITGVQEYGFFCMGIDIPAEGLVHTGTFDDDRYDFDVVSHAITARRSGHRYRLGDKVRVIVAHVDVDRRQLDFRLAASRSGMQVRERKSTGKTRPHDEPRHRDRSGSRGERHRRGKRR